MSEKTIRFPITIGVKDEAGSCGRLDHIDGTIARHPVAALRHLPAGHPLIGKDISQAEADSIVERWGTFDAPRLPHPHSRANDPR